MIGFARHQAASAPPQRPDTALAMERVGATPLAMFAAIPAAWPSGVSPLAIALDVCQDFDRAEMRYDRTAGIRD